MNGNSLLPGRGNATRTGSQDCRATRPKVERQIAHLMHRRHGGRRARVRGATKVAADFALLAAAVNLARLAVLALANTPSKDPQAVSSTTHRSPRDRPTLSPCGGVVPRPSAVSGQIRSPNTPGFACCSRESGRL